MTFMDRQILAASLILDIEDCYAKRQLVYGGRPLTKGKLWFGFTGKKIEEKYIPLDPVLKLVTKTNPSGYVLFFGEVELPDSTVRRMPPTQDTSVSYTLRIESEHYQVAEVDELNLHESRTPYHIGLEPGYRYPFTSTACLFGKPTLVRGTVRGYDGAGIRDVIIKSQGAIGSYRTDSTGQWVLVMDPDSVGPGMSVQFVFPDGSSKVEQNITIEKGKEIGLMQAGLCGRVEYGVGVGAENTVITIVGVSGSVRTDVNGAWRFYFPLGQCEAVVAVKATLPDGRTKYIGDVLVKTRSLMTVPTFQFP